MTLRTVALSEAMPLAKPLVRINVSEGEEKALRYANVIRNS
ncbi:hypothetical protein [Nostoc sp. LPT]|nr:hypothetical protein [Nostoc sp. LPT]